MKRPKLKKASKRVSCAKKYKIQKKVREHHRKLRREAKKKGVPKQVKKDPGVPSIAPFREEVLREAEQRRLKIEEEKEKQKQARKDERAKKRKREKEALAKESDPKAKIAKKEVAKQEKRKSVDKSSKKFLCSELKKVLDASDVIVEVLDARDPMGSRCPQLEEAVLQGDGNRKLLFLLNKIDLVPKENVEKWISCLEQEFPVVAFKAATLIQDKTVQQKKSRIQASNPVLDRSRAAACFGGSCLLELLHAYAATKSTSDAQGPLKVGIVGFPNVGKSSLINSMKGIRTCNAGVLRGITKSMQDVHISKLVKLLDSPGIVASTSNPPASLALRSLQVEEGQEKVQDAVRSLLKQCNQSQIMLQYNVPDFRNSQEFVNMYAKKHGLLLKGGVPNADLAATTFLNDWTGAKLSYQCKVPENCSLPPYLSDAAVAEQRKDWDLAKLNAGNEETLKNVKFPSQAGSIGFLSDGPTAGLLSVPDSPDPPVTRVPLQDQDTQAEQEDISEVSATEPVKTAVISKKPRVHFQSVPVNIDLSTAASDDAYDFNTDFK